MGINVAVLGATGAVGREMISILEERDFPVSTIKLLASKHSAGTVLSFNNQPIIVEEVQADSFKGMDLALFSAGGDTSKHWAPIAAQSGCVVVDNSSAWRMDENVPLIVPEVNPHAIKIHNGIIANPNCSTIQMVVALKPIYDLAGIKRIIVSTYQAVSGSGHKAIIELENQLEAIKENKIIKSEVYPYQIANNCLPHISDFLENGYTKEEIKMVKETQKIFDDFSIAITATTVRVPVIRGHSESVFIETKQSFNLDDLKCKLAETDGIIIKDDIANNIYPTPLQCEKKDSVYIGRIRRDLFCDNAISMWIVSDNLRKGAALNAVQIGELLFK